MRNRIIMLLMSMLVAVTIQLTADTLIDTTYSVPEMDGCIDYNTQWNTYYADIYTMITGDFWDWYNGGNCYVRSFVSIPLPEVPYGYDLDSAYLYIYQNVSFGNSLEGLFPIWDISSGSYEVPCYVDHVDYGSTLDIGDFNSGVLENCIGIISEAPEDGWRELEITQYVQEDIQEEREYSQYRMHFPIDTDLDNLDDCLYFISGLPGSRSSYIRFVFTYGAAIDDEVSSEGNMIMVSPNPFINSTTIDFSSRQGQVKNVEVYNLKGQLIRELKIQN
ncbi:MAG: hypothetical protein RAP70_00355 [Candidatus Celaenobacter antarcticus]|nr:hypothetical protein [Candidatus Celaenobacter antarcticus]